MDVIIVGCGRVGYILADHLSKEGHNITVIDTDEEKLQPALADGLELGDARGGDAVQIPFKMRRADARQHDMRHLAQL